VNKTFLKGIDMTRQRIPTAGEEGFALVYMAAILAVLLLFTGLAVDTGRAYVVKAQLTKAVDGAALAAARTLNSGDPKGEATRIFNANFPTTYMGVSSVTDPTSDPGFFSIATDTASGVNTVTVNATAVLPTTFMQLANFKNVTVTSSGQAQRRMVDLSLIIDVSSSIGSKWTAVHDSAVDFIDSFDAAHDRVSLVTFGNGASVIDPMPAGRGFDKVKVEGDVPSTLPGGSTLMVEGLYRGWDQLRTVPAGSQSGLRIIVLFTDGASNGVPGNWDASGTAKALRTWDFPKSVNDPDSQTWDSPHIDGLYDTQTGGASPSVTLTVPWNSTTTIGGAEAWMPPSSWHTHHSSAGIPTTFPLQSAALTVNGAAQTSARGLRHFDAASGKFPAEVFNINNAARNVLEIIADAARNDNGDYPIRIYTIGMGYLVRDLLGTMPETPESILMRISNDKLSPDHKGTPQLDGKYFYAATAADVAPAFQGIQNEIVRLSK
jgi:Flp pilus assembly protein TadG